MDIQRQNAINYIRSELQIELNKKMDKSMNYSRIILLQKILKILV